MKKRLMAFTLACMFILSICTPIVAANTDFFPTKIIAAGETSVTVQAGQNFELKVIADGDDDYLSWYVSGESDIVKITDNDVNDDDIDLYAIKEGQTSVTCEIQGTDTKVTFDITVNKAPVSDVKKIYAVGSLSKTAKLYRELELKVKRDAGISKNDLKWSITGKKGIVKFDDNDLYDDDVDIIGIKKGTTTVTCTNTKTKQKINYTIKVIQSNIWIRREGNKTKKTRVGKDIELGVHTNVDDDYLYWYVSGEKGIVRIESDDIYDDDIEIHALKKGTTTVTCEVKGTTKKVSFKVKVSKRKGKKQLKIFRVGSRTKYVGLYDDRDLEVRKQRDVADNDLKWYISGKKGIVRFDDTDLYDDEVEIVGIKRGTTTVTCKNLITNKKVKYTIKVVRNYDDDDDDD